MSALCLLPQMRPGCDQTTAMIMYAQTYPTICAFSHLPAVASLCCPGVSACHPIHLTTNGSEGLLPLQASWKSFVSFLIFLYFSKALQWSLSWYECPSAVPHSNVVDFNVSTDVVCVVCCHGSTSEGFSWAWDDHSCFNSVHIASICLPCALDAGIGPWHLGTASKSWTRLLNQTQLSTNLAFLSLNILTLSTGKCSCKLDGVWCSFY